MRKVICSVMTAVLLVGLLFGCTTTPAPAPKPPPAPYKIGINNCLTGGFSVYAVDYQEAFEMLAEKINAEGGINGHPLELVVRDAESDPVTSVSNVRSLAATGVLVTLGSPSTTLAVADIPVADEVKMPYVLLSPMLPPVPPGSYGFGWVGASNEGIVKGRNLAAASVGLRRLALLSPQDPGAEVQTKLHQDFAAETGVEIVGMEWMLLTDSDVTPQLMKLRMTNPDAVVNGGSGKASVVQYKSLKQLGWKIPMITLIATPAFIEAIGEDADMVWLWCEAIALRPDTIPETHPTRDLIIETSNLWRERTGKPFAAIAVWGWDSLSSLVEVLQELNLDPATEDLQDMRDKIRDALEHQSFQGMSGAIHRSPSDHHGGGVPWTCIGKIVEGQYFVPITDADLAKYEK